jgi:enoyl-CoA hydratase
MNLNTLTVEYVDKISIVRINRPDKLNALNRETLLELKEVFQKLNEDNNVYSIILTGAGEKAFVAGADISELNKLSMLEGKQFAEFGQDVFNYIEEMEKPVVAAVNGFALGGGCELALACHFRYASENAKFGQPEVNLGIIPGYGGTQRLPRLVGKGKAMEMILTGNLISAEEALSIGLVNKVFKKEELLTKTIETLNLINSKGQQAIRLAVKAVNSTRQINLNEGLNYEALLFGLCCGTNDFKEGTLAFLEKRNPNFTNT